MTAIEKLNFVVSTYGRMLLALFNFRLWPPFFIYGVVMVLIALAIVSMFSSLLSGWVIPLTVALTSDDALHYPRHLSLLPYTFQMFNLVPSLLLESLLTAAGVLMFVGYFRRERFGFTTALKSASRFYPKIVVIWFINIVLVYLFFKFFPGLFRGVVSGSPRREIALVIGMQALTALLFALFVYAIPYLVIRGRSLGGSLSGSFSMFFRNFFTTYVFVALPQLVTAIWAILLQRTAVMVGKFNPEMVVLMTFGLVILLTLANFFTTGCIVRFFLEASED